MVGWWSACQLGWLDGARDVWLVSWLVVEDGEAGREAVCLDEWLVVEDGEAGREAVSLVGWLAVGLSAWVIVGWWADGRAVSVDGERLSAWLVGWWSSCHLGWLASVVAVWVLSCELG